jgi:iron-sulfur cluster repair protein YtfE (RIC family)
MSLSSHSPSLAEARPPLKQDVLELMREAHEHIRSFTALAVQLGHAEDVPPARLSETASRLIRFFMLSLPRHFEDEDHVLVPRLFTTTLSLEMVEHLWAAGRQHEEIEQLVERLVPLWTAVRDTPEHYPELTERLATGGRNLMKLMEVHLMQEEQYLFPLIRSRLTREVLSELATRILDRQGQLI